MKQTNYLQQLNLSRSTSKFNILFESIMSDTNIDMYKHIKTLDNLSDSSLNLILEEIEKPQYVICESSGEAILLEDAIFMPESYLISEGILDKVTEKMQQIVDWIIQGLQNVLHKSLEVIKTFCEKVKNNPIVAAIRKKLNLDEQIDNEKLKKFFELKKTDKVATESVITENDDDYIFTEATKLSKAEEALTDPVEINKFIKKYADYLSGKTVLKNKRTGKPLTRKYCQDRLRLFKRKLASLQQTSQYTYNGDNNISVSTDPAYNTSTTDKPKRTVAYNKNDSTTAADKATDTGIEHTVKLNGKTPQSNYVIEFKLEDFVAYVKTVSDNATVNDKIKQAAEANVDKNTVETDTKEDEQQETTDTKKPGLLLKLKNKIKSGVQWLMNNGLNIIKLIIKCTIIALAVVGLCTVLAILIPEFFGILMAGYAVVSGAAAAASTAVAGAISSIGVYLSIGSSMVGSAVMTSSASALSWVAGCPWSMWFGSIISGLIAGIIGGKIAKGK